MKISTNWLQTYFKEKLPAPEALAELFTFHAFEVEGIEKAENGDIVLDLKVLPDRAHYALSHKGVALEAALMTGIDRQEQYPVKKIAGEPIPLSIKVETNLCRRYIGRVIEGVQVTDSPAWLSALINPVGQRSINSIVDSTNLVMLNVGQPLHAFDRAKVKGGIVVRMARDGEKITLLDGKEIMLDSSMMVIADDEGALAIAGVKGGKRAEVTPETKDIIIESANFDPVSVRRTSTKIGIRNDSSKRFENNLSPEVAEEGMDNITATIQTMLPEAKVGQIVYIYPEKPKPVHLEIDPEEVNAKLGVTVSATEMITILRKLEIAVEEKGKLLALTMPLYRQDLHLFEDIVEEIGRTYGYEKIAPILPEKPNASLAIDKTFYYSEKIKNILRDSGFSEVYLYTFVKEGEVEVAKPLASDKKALRTNLSEVIEDALVRNTRNSDLLELDQIKLFEIGKVFSAKGERTMLALGATQIKKVKGFKSENLIEEAQKALETGLGISIAQQSKSTQVGAVVELDLDQLLEKLPEPGSFDIELGKLPALQYKPFSIYPFITRDVAVFVSPDTTEADLYEMIKKEAGDLLVRSRLFDTFSKQFPDGTTKTSYAYRLVFQSFERTLTDEEINPIMDRVYALLASKGFEIR